MSNRATIQRTVFVDFQTDEKSFGYRIYDDHGQSYCNVMEEADLKLGAEDFLRKAQDTFDETANSIFDSALDNGIYIDSDWYRFKLDGDTWKFAGCG